MHPNVNDVTVLTAIGIMAAVTYLPRVVPLAVFRKRIKNNFVQSFLMYMPYGVLAAMVFPAILTSTAGLVSAVAGLAVALAMSYKNLGLMPVALGATATVFAVEQIGGLLGIWV